MSIDTQVPANIKVPGFYAAIRAALGIYTQNLSSIMIGQSVNTVDVEPVLISNADQAKTLFGFGSQLAFQVAAFLKINSFSELWVLPLQDAPSSVAATGAFTITGTATENGTDHIYVVGRYIPVGVSAGDSVSSRATNIAAAINLQHLPVIATSSLGVVTITARNKGTKGNTIDLRINHLATTGNQKTPAGSTVVVTPMSGGAGDPSLQTGLTAIGDLPYEYFGVAYNDTTSLNSLSSFLESRWEPTKQLYGMGFSAAQGSLSTLQTLGASRNDRLISILGYYDSPTWDVEAVAMYTAVAAREFNTDPALGLQTLPLNDFVVPKPVSQFTLGNRQTLLSAGIATLDYAAGRAQISRSITTYQKNVFGQSDASWLDLTTPATVALITRELRNMVGGKYARVKLAADDTKIGAGQDVVTPKTIKGDIIALYTSWVNRGLCQNFDGFAASLLVELNPTDPNRVDVLLPPTLINNLLIFATKVEFSLTI